MPGPANSPALRAMAMAAPAPGSSIRGMAPGPLDPPRPAGAGAAAPAPSGVRVELVAWLAGAAAQEGDVGRVVDLLLDEILARYGARLAQVYEASEPRRELTLLAHRGLPPDSAARRTRIGFDAPFLAARAASARSEQIVEDVAAIDPSLTEADEEVFRGAGAIVSLPLFALGRLAGVLTYARPEPHRFDGEELATMRVVADVFGSSLVLGQATRVAQRFRTQLHALSRADAALTEALGSPGFELRAVLAVVAEQARLVASARYAAIGLETRADVPFEPWVFAGVSPELARVIGHAPRPVGLLGLVPHEDRTVRVRDLREHPAFGGFPPHHPPMKAFLGVPIRFAGVVIGNLYLTDKLDGDEFTEDDQAAIELLAARAGAAVRQASARAAAEVDRAQANAIFSNAPHGLLFLDTRTRRTIANPRSIELFGRAVLPGTPPEALMAAFRRPDGSAMADAEHPIRRALAGETVRAEEARLVQPTGAALPVLVSAAPALSAGRAVGAIVLFEDLSKQVRLREAIDAERRRLETSLGSVPQGVILIDETGMILAANRSASEIAPRFGSCARASRRWAAASPSRARSAPAPRSPSRCRSRSRRRRSASRPIEGAARYARSRSAGTPEIFAPAPPRRRAAPVRASRGRRQGMRGPRHPRGSRTRNVVRSPGPHATSMAPPCASAIPLQMARPRPVPRTPFAVVARKNRVKTCGRSASGMTGPSFVTESRASASPTSSSTRMLVPGAPYFAAFDSRLPSSCSTRPGSTRARGSRPRTSIRMGRPSVAGVRSQTSRTSAPRSVSCRSRPSSPASMRATSSRSSIIRSSVLAALRVRSRTRPFSPPEAFSRIRSSTSTSIRITASGWRRSCAIRATRSSWRRRVSLVRVASSNTTTAPRTRPSDPCTGCGTFESSCLLDWLTCALGLSDPLPGPDWAGGRNHKPEATNVRSRPGA